MSIDCFILPDFASCSHGLARVDAGLLLLSDTFILPAKQSCHRSPLLGKEQELSVGWDRTEQDRQVLAASPSWEPVSGVPGTELAETSSFSSCCLMQDQWGIKFLLSMF